MHNETLLRGQLEAQANFQNNIRIQFKDALTAMRRIEREAYDRDSSWIRYSSHYQRLLTLAQQTADFDGPQSIPAQLQPRAATDMISIGAPKATGYNETRGIHPGHEEAQKDFNLSQMAEAADKKIASAKKRK
jgi:hypothetical protein